MVWNRARASGASPLGCGGVFPGGDQRLQHERRRVGVRDERIGRPIGEAAVRRQQRGQECQPAIDHRIVTVACRDESLDDEAVVFESAAPGAVEPSNAQPPSVPKARNGSSAASGSPRWRR